MSITCGLALLLFASALTAAETSASQDTRYLAFQIFTGGFDSAQLKLGIPPPNEQVAQAVDGLVRKLGSTGVKGRKLGFVVGPLAFDNTDEDVRRLIRQSFWLAKEKKVAVGFHIDDSMFWGRLKELDRPENLEKSGWDAAPNTGRRLDWSSRPLKIMPQLCLNSPAVMAAAARRAAVMGEEIRKGVRLLYQAGQEDLFLGVIVGWESQIGPDFDGEKALGYCALANAGYGPGNPPKDADAARERVVSAYVDFWAAELSKAGVPEAKMYSHNAFFPRVVYDMVQKRDPEHHRGSYAQHNRFTPPSVAFGAHHRPGFSTYPLWGHLEQLRAELKRHGDPPWASAEGTAIDPGEAEKGGKPMSMEAYLGNLFNHGARVVNVFGWGVGPEKNPFRRTAESAAALAAYRKFLGGGTLSEMTFAKPSMPSPTLEGKLHRIQRDMPAYGQKHGGQVITPMAQELDGHLKKQEFDEAEKTADQILRLLGAAP